MTVEEDFQYIRPIDQAALHAGGPDARVRQILFDAKNGALNFIRTPAGGGSPEGTHTHKFDQIYYVLSGTMFVEINGEESIVQPSSAVVFPAGVPHRNWNEEETIHLALRVETA
jgi:mannose-6-phosphate isomerase-like protein (cupin superfamily)